MSRVEVEIYKDGEYVMTCSSLSEAHLVTGNSLTTISAVEKTREHRAWEKLVRRLDYLNSFDGNRSQMEKTTRLAKQVWDDAGHEEEPEDPDHYPVENIGFDNSAVDCVQVQELKFMNESGIGLDEFDTESFIRYLAKKAEELDRIIENEKQKNG